MTTEKENLQLTVVNYNCELQIIYIESSIFGDKNYLQAN